MIYVWLVEEFSPDGSSTGRYMPTDGGNNMTDTREALTPATMKRGGRYNWKNQPERLIYLRKFDGWHQFKKIGDPREVWCEVLDADLNMLEETHDE